MTQWAPAAPTVACLVLALASFGAAADGRAATPDAVPVAPLTVIGVSPLPGGGVDVDTAPVATQAVTGADLARNGAPNAVGALADRLAAVNLGDNLDDPFQPDILLRGFEASPVLGTPQGVAVYQNGARINEAFGETVNWDLIPDIAVRRLEVMGANPVFGLNALGGAVVVDMKTGFSDPGGDLSVSGGSFGRREASAQYGANDGTLSVYLAGRGLDEDGWRRFSPDHLRQLYGDVGVKHGGLTLDLSVTVADNHLFGESSAPVQELAVDRALTFTSPQETANRLTFVTLNAAYAVAPTLSLQGAAYYRGFRQSLTNGNTTGYVACGPGPALGSLCQSDGVTPLTDGAGRPIPDISDGGAVPLGELDQERISADGYGGSAQATVSTAILRRENRLTVGASVDAASTDFSSSAEVGIVNAAVQVLPSGPFVDTPENTAFTATPVDLHAATTDVGLYASDAFHVARGLTVTASGRYNVARVVLSDRRGSDLDGRNTYRRFNPALGAAYGPSRALTVYGGYSEGSRAPNASEIECSNPLIPCLLPSSLASDPPTLRQVVSRTWEAGLRGRFRLAGGAVSWNAGLFRTDVADDIYAAATSLSAGYFQNIGGTRRQGADLGLRYAGRTLSAYLSYSYVDATFRSAFTLPSPSNLFSDAAGDIQVRPGDRLPGIPRHRLKLGADYEVRRGWSVGGHLTLVGDQVYRGDESNQLAPLAGYVVVGLRSTLQLTPRLSLFALVDNALNARYATFGVLGDPTGVGAPGVPPAGAAADPRFQSPAAPISVYGGLKLTF